MGDDSSSSYPGAISAAVATARLACASQQGFSEWVQLNATQKLGVSCQPLENGGLSAPCLHEPFFHFPAGFEQMDADEMAARWRRIDPFNQCRSRRTDADWPTLEMHHTRTAATKRMDDVMRTLGRRNVTLVGASVMRQTFIAMQCALETYGLRKRHELQWRHWGWATFSADNGGCGANFTRDLQPRTASGMERLRRLGCVAAGTKFGAMLDRTDVVVVGYNPQHYEGRLDWWRHDLEAMLPLLEAFGRRHGKLAVVREPPAQHFAGGSYDPGAKAFVSSAQGCCRPVSPERAFHNYNWHATQTLRELVSQLAPHVRVLSWYNETLRRHGAHIGTRAACFERKALSSSSGEGGPPIGAATRKATAKRARRLSLSPASPAATRPRGHFVFGSSASARAREIPTAVWTRKRECFCDW